ncbi:hypothetical protein AWV79_19410 [Cupriavidus sp. UYMMa02A]|nr:hypothetical protein AWV79_19410 [Cupriavidus sp. UYMMa02A]
MAGAGAAAAAGSGCRGGEVLDDDSVEAELEVEAAAGHPRQRAPRRTPPGRWLRRCRRGNRSRTSPNP